MEPLERYHVLKDGTLCGSAATRENAIRLIRSYQAQETHPILRSEFSLIKGKEEFIPYPSEKEEPEQDPGSQLTL